MADIPGDASTTEAVTVGSNVTNSLEFVGDRDWFRINLTAGQAITVTLNGVTLEDPYLRIRDASGNVIYENDDINTAVNLDSQLSFAANYTGVFYIDVGSWNDEGAGDYQLNVTTWTQPPLWDNDQIAGQLTSGYWGDGPHAFLLDGSRTITVNITGLTVEGTLLARAALDAWTDVTGIHFQEVQSGGQITFDDDQEGAWTDAIYSNGVISTAHVNIDTAWIAAYGYTIGTYTFQAYVHEIGHALGLGHAGNYNNDATYPYDALYRNDAWNTSIMSYFSAAENTYFGGQGFTDGFAMTPMVADILAVQQLYGLSTTTRTGDTTYGSSTNTGRLWYDANLNPDGVITIFDNGGIDTLDYSGFSANQTINLTPESFSSVGTGVGNLSIARGTTIENAIGGTGNDTLIGNSLNNVLTGSGGNDAIDGGGGSDTASYALTASGVTVNLGLAGPQNTVGAGNDTLTSIENLVGSNWNDTLTGSSSTNFIDAGGGNDSIDGGNGNDTLAGGAGNDTINGGSGTDFASYAGDLAGVTVSLGIAGGQNTLGSGTDSLISVEGLIGSGYNDRLTGNSSANSLLGGAGDDFLIGAGGIDALDGGEGSDVYILASSADHSSAEFSDTGTSGADEVRFAATGTAQTLTLASGDTGIERIVIGTGTAAAAVITGLLAHNVDAHALLNGVTITGNSGANTLTGTSFVDTLQGGNGEDRFYGNGGNDILDGGRDRDIMYGGVGDDTYVVDHASDAPVEKVGEGIDLVLASVAHTLKANVENLTLTGIYSILGRGNEMDNIITGNSGSNRMFGMAGNDTLIGNEGTDRLDGGTGNDILIGGVGNDTYYVDSLGDSITENTSEGRDTVEATLSWTLGDNLDWLVLAGTSSINGTGNELANVLRGNVGANSLSGLAGNDKIYAGSGNDTLNGGDGNDWLEGGIGTDTYTGGIGSDRFVFREGDFGGNTTGTADIITDFGDAEGDRIHLSVVDANTTIAGNQAFAFIGSSAFTGTAGELRYEQISGNTFVSGDTNGDGIADFMIRLNGLHALVTNDFVF